MSTRRISDWATSSSSPRRARQAPNLDDVHHAVSIITARVGSERLSPISHNPRRKLYMAHKADWGNRVASRAFLRIRLRPSLTRVGMNAPGSARSRMIGHTRRIGQSEEGRIALGAPHQWRVIIYPYRAPFRVVSFKTSIVSALKALGPMRAISTCLVLVDKESVIRARRIGRHSD